MAKLAPLCCLALTIVAASLFLEVDSAPFMDLQHLGQYGNAKDGNAAPAAFAKVMSSGDDPIKSFGTIFSSMDNNNKDNKGQGAEVQSVRASVKDSRKKNKSESEEIEVSEEEDDDSYYSDE